VNEGFQQDLGIPRRPELHALAFELAAKRGKVVDLPVVDEAVASAAVPERLITARVQVEEGETGGSESYASVGENSLVVRASVLEKLCREVELPRIRSRVRSVLQDAEEATATRRMTISSPSTASVLSRPVPVGTSSIAASAMRRSALVSTQSARKSKAPSRQPRRLEIIEAP
jgi:hypothetical protein